MYMYLKCFSFCVSLDAQEYSDKTILRLLATGHESDFELCTGDGYEEERMEHPTNEIFFAEGPTIK